VPFDLLQVAADTGPLLIERFDISYLPSAAFLLRNVHVDEKSWRVPWSRELVAFGDPKIPSQSDPLAQALPEKETRGRLPMSAEEVRVIARISRGRSELYLGADDLKKYLLQGRVKGTTLLHLSTHATVDAENPERSRILFSPENDSQTPDYLFLKEIYDLDLRGINLTTLSACDTERGRLIRGEGIQGFSRALLSAGSRAAVTTLWRVNDQPTAEFMKQFYYALEQGRPSAEALRQAKLRFLRSGSAQSHPRHWAAFVLTGDGQHPAQRALSWNVLLLPLVGLLMAFGFVVRRFGYVRTRTT
jgi:CHAT domain-containing protein